MINTGEALAKEKHLKTYLENLGQVVVAFSGGVDSTYLLAMAREVLGTKVRAVTIRTNLVPKRELLEAEALIAQLQVGHCYLDFDELEIEGLADNPPNRCYLCKKTIFTAIKNYAQELQAVVVDGSNKDDEGDYRPGMQALAELEVQSPLRAVGLTKAEIRFLSKERGLATWAKPSFACLASRVPYGESITREKLAMVEQAEDYLLERGFKQLRVRIHGDLARIEVPESEYPRLANLVMRQAVAEKFKNLGFSYVALDITGYRTGSMNEVL